MKVPPNPKWREPEHRCEWRERAERAERSLVDLNEDLAWAEESHRVALAEEARNHLDDIRLLQKAEAEVARLTRLRGISEDDAHRAEAELAHWRRTCECSPASLKKNNELREQVGQIRATLDGNDQMTCNCATYGSAHACPIHLQHDTLDDQGGNDER